MTFMSNDAGLSFISWPVPTDGEDAMAAAGMMRTTRKPYFKDCNNKLTYNDGMD